MRALTETKIKTVTRTADRLNWHWDISSAGENFWPSEEQTLWLSIPSLRAALWSLRFLWCHPFPAVPRMQHLPGTQGVGEVLICQLQKPHKNWGSARALGPKETKSLRPGLCSPKGHTSHFRSAKPCPCVYGWVKSCPCALPCPQQGHPSSALLATHVQADAPRSREGIAQHHCRCCKTWPWKKK